MRKKSARVKNNAKQPLNHLPCLLCFDLGTFGSFTIKSCLVSVRRLFRPSCPMHSGDAARGMDHLIPKRIGRRESEAQDNEESFEGPHYRGLFGV